MFNKFDRIKVVAELSKVRINGNYFIKRMNPELDEVISEEYNSVGLRVFVRYRTSKVYIDFSSKILAGDYTEKININNLSEVFRKINRVVEMSPYYFYRLPPNYIEVVSDIRQDDVPIAIESLFFLSRFQTEYKPTAKMYKSNHAPTSFDLKRNRISKPSYDSMSIYNKYTELFRARKNENVAFLQTLTGEEIEMLRAYFTNVLRIESKYLSKSRIKTVLGHQDREYNLYNIVTSDRNANEEMLNRIYQEDYLGNDERGSVTHKRFDKLSSLKLDDFDLDRMYAEHLLYGG